MSARRLSDFGVLVLKGMGMGAADVIPGVSGGTIAFITGIYEELVFRLILICLLMLLFQDLIGIDHGVHLPDAAVHAQVGHEHRLDSDRRVRLHGIQVLGFHTQARNQALLRGEITVTAIWPAVSPYPHPAAGVFLRCPRSWSSSSSTWDTTTDKRGTITMV